MGEFVTPTSFAPEQLLSGKGVSCSRAGVCFMWVRFRMRLIEMQTGMDSLGTDTACELAAAIPCSGPYWHCGNGIVQRIQLYSGFHLFDERTIFSAVGCSSFSLRWKRMEWARLFSTRIPRFIPTVFFLCFWSVVV